MSTFGDFVGNKIVNYLEHNDNSLQQLLIKKGYIVKSCQRRAKGCSKYYIKTNDYLQRIPLSGFWCGYCGLVSCDNCSKKSTFMNFCIPCSFRCSSFNSSFSNGISSIGNIVDNGKAGYFSINTIIDENDIACTECNSTKHVDLFQISPEHDTTIAMLMCSMCRILV